MTVGRNEPCPCGSGKKFKRCCGAPTVDPLAHAARSVRDVLDRLEPRLLRYVRERLGEDALDFAWNEFLGDAEGIDRGGPEIQAFIPWLLYRWIPATSPAYEGLPDALKNPVAEAFCESRPGPLGPGDDAILRRVTRSPFSFHEVTASEPGRVVRLRDVFTEDEVEVFEQSGSESLRVGDILYGRVVAFENVALLIGSGAVALPPDSKIPLLDMRKGMRKDLGQITAISLLLFDEVLRETYFALRQQALAPLTLQNTDGEPLEFHTLTWKIDSPDDAFRALASLCHHMSESEIRKDATLDDAGHVRRIEFSWSKAKNSLHADWDNTVLGRILIADSKLTVEVNSGKRAERIRGEVAKRLGGHAFGPSIVTKSAEDSLREQDEREPSAGRKKPSPQDEAFLRSPEVQEFMRQREEAQWDAWVSERIPALGNRRPIQLVKTKEGREKVEALLLSFERRGQPPEFGEPYDMNRVRARLGLPPRETLRRP